MCCVVLREPFKVNGRYCGWVETEVIAYCKTREEAETLAAKRNRRVKKGTKRYVVR